ncbi:MAG: MucB/RseB C-terminal domain-containing protein [Motiliproteus sp.]
MSENLRQSLSALMDDEVDEFEVRRCLQQLDDKGASTWSRYQIVSAVLKGEKLDAKIDLSSSVMAAIASEPAYEKASQAKDGFWKPLASVAVAASVTAMVIFGAQNYQDSSLVGDAEFAAAQPQLFLPGPAPVNRNILPAQYGSSADVVSMPRSVEEPDVIRLSNGMEHYINQHHALMRSKQKSWTANWMPEGYSEVRHEVMPDSEVMMYSDGRTAISVSVEPYGRHKSAPGAVQSGGTVALGKQVGNQFVTVVGDLPLMIADRIASSVDRSANP